MNSLQPCPSCRRHVRAADNQCPFCGRSVTSLAPSRRAVKLVAASMAVGLACAACYGGPPPGMGPQPTIDPNAIPAQTPPASPSSTPK